MGNRKMTRSMRKKKMLEKMAKRRESRITAIMISDIPGRLKNQLIELGTTISAENIEDGRLTLDAIVDNDDFDTIRFLVEHRVEVPEWEFFTPEIQEYLNAANELKEVDKKLKSSKPAIEEGKGKE